MPFTPTVWEDYPDIDTPVTAAQLNRMEAGIDAAVEFADNIGIPDTLVDAKGDLILGTAADTVGRKAVGADDSVLAASAGESTGVVWKKIGNAMVATDAAIAVSKLAPGAAAEDILTTIGGVAVWDAHAATSYTPTWTQSSSNPTLGNGSLTGSYLRIGKFMMVRVSLTLGSSTTLGSGRWLFSTPVTIDQNSPFGTGNANDVGTAIHMLFVHPESTTKTAMRNTSGTLVDNTSPFTWSPASGDTLTFSYVVIAA